MTTASLTRSHNKGEIPYPFGEISLEIAVLSALKNGKGLGKTINSLKHYFEGGRLDGISEDMVETVQYAWSLAESYIPFRRTGTLFKKYALNRIEANPFRGDSFHIVFWLAVHSESIDQFKKDLEKIEGLLTEGWLKRLAPPKWTDVELSRLRDFAACFRKMGDRDWDRLTALGHAERPLIWFLGSFVAVVAFVALIPFFAVIGMIILFSEGRPVFFVQERVGRFGKQFRLLKFRTMYSQKQFMGKYDSAEWPGVTEGGDPRVTPFGRFLRKFKMDEFPQLWNIAMGEMEFVGYRPELPENVAKAEADYAMLCQQRPGITDPASLAFINENEILSELKREHGDLAYDQVILPIKTSKSLNYLLTRIKDSSDFAVIIRTIYESFFRDKQMIAKELPLKDDLPKPIRRDFDGADAWVAKRLKSEGPMTIPDSHDARQRHDN